MSSAPPVRLSAKLLRSWPLPQPDEEGDKEDRGRVLVVAGAPEMPGAVILAATAALRAGAGKLHIATCRSIAQAVAVAIPEARVSALPETRKGAIAVSAVPLILKYAKRVHSVVIGPGMIDESAVTRLMKGLLPHLKDVTVVIDAAALGCFNEAKNGLKEIEGLAVFTPHAGEMANMLNLELAEINRNSLVIARRAAHQFGAVVALKGAETFIVGKNGRAFSNRARNVGLATSGSGDTLAGIIAGLVARGADPIQAAAWGVYLHAQAGDRLAKRMGTLGFLARELLAEIPPLMSELGTKRRKVARR